MSETGGLRTFRLRGPGVTAALEWLHVHADLAGVHEQGADVQVWAHGSLPTLPGRFVLEVVELRVAAADFAHTGLEQDAPIVVADDLLVRPPWVERPAGFTGVELVVPRGGAFGSGEDDSTKAALLAMHRTWSAPASVADIGTGTGILALYAHVRGCERIAACDIDEPSVRAARALLPTASVQLGTADGLAPADLVVANMTGSELLGALAGILCVWTGRNLLILGGLRGDESDVLAAKVAAAMVGTRSAIKHRETIGVFSAIVIGCERDG